MKTKTKNKDQPRKTHIKIKEMWIITKKTKAMGNRLEWILGSSNYCKEAWKQKQKQRSTNQKSSRNEKK